MNVLALVLSGGMGAGLSAMTQQRAKPAVPCFGKYRMIDFPLSNLINSSIQRIAIIVQRYPFSLIEHVGSGKSFDLYGQDRPGLQIWQPYQGRTDLEEYLGTADAVYQNRKYIAEDGNDSLLILSGDHIYKQDFRAMLNFHREKEALLTIATMTVPRETAHQYGLLEVNADERITSFIEKPPDPKSTLASMGIYLFNTAYLLRLLEQDARTIESGHDFGRNIIPQVVEQGDAYAFHFNGYWLNINHVETYWKSQMAILDHPSLLDLNDPDWAIYTRVAQRPPMRVTAPGKVVNSLVSDGCVIDGEVIHSVLSPGVRVEAGAVIRDSVIMDETVICAGAAVARSVIDKEVVIGAAAQIGGGTDWIPNQEDPGILYAGITVIGKRAIIPGGVSIGHNVRVDADVTPLDFLKPVIASGETVHAHR